MPTIVVATFEKIQDNCTIAAQKAHGTKKKIAMLWIEKPMTSTEGQSLQAVTERTERLDSSRPELLAEASEVKARHIRMMLDPHAVRPLLFYTIASIRSQKRCSTAASTAAQQFRRSRTVQAKAFHGTTLCTHTSPSVGTAGTCDFLGIGY